MPFSESFMPKMVSGKFKDTNKLGKTKTSFDFAEREHLRRSQRYEIKIPFRIIGAFFVAKLQYSQIKIGDYIRMYTDGKPKL